MADTPVAETPVASAVPAAAEPAAVTSPAVEPAAAPAEAAPAPEKAAEPAKESKSEPSLLEAAEGKKPEVKPESAAEPKKEEAKETPAPAEAAKSEAKSEGEKPKEEAKKDEAAKAPDPAKEATATEPPAIKYEPFKVPDGIKLDDKKVEAFTGLLNDAKLSPQDRAQKLVDLYTENVQAMAQELRQEQRTVWNKLNDTWKTDTRKELGNHYETDLAMAKAVIEEFGGTAEQKREYMAHLSNNGMGNFIGHIRLLRNIGKALNVFEDNTVPANPTAPRMPKSPGNRGWYPSMNGSNQ